MIVYRGTTDGGQSCPEIVNICDHPASSSRAVCVDGDADRGPLHRYVVVVVPIRSKAVSSMRTTDLFRPAQPWLRSRVLPIRPRSRTSHTARLWFVERVPRARYGRRLRRAAPFDQLGALARDEFLLDVLVRGAVLLLQLDSVARTPNDLVQARTSQIAARLGRRVRWSWL